jgi:AbrB family looped-hinge helix DNA binding protein
MPESMLDGEGKIALPADVREALGWKPGQELHLQVEGDQLLVQPATRATSLKDEARRLADAMRGLTAQAARQVADKVSGLQQSAAGGQPSAAGGQRAGGGQLSAFQGISPNVGDRVYLAPGSIVIGDVALGEDASLWGGVVARGDVAPVRIGARTNIQEGAVVHVSPHVPCVIGSGVTVGHQATVHACTVGDTVLIGIQAVVLDGAKIGERCIIAAGAVVPPDTEIPPGKMVMGVPARVVRDLTPQEVERIHWNADAYVSLKNEYLNPTAAPAAPREAPPKPAPPERGSLPRYEVRRAAGEIQVDGSLDDPGWAGIPAMSALVQADGSGAAEQPTEVKLCWDDAHLYISFACKDADVWGNFQGRDDPVYDEEAVEAFLCPSGDVRHYFEIDLSPLNTLFDAKVFNPDGERATLLVDPEWNAPGIRTAVRISGKVNDRTSPDLGWIAELAIPFLDLGGPPSPGAVWRANFFRIERGEATEFTAWSPTYRDPADFHVPSCFGELVFLSGAE